MVWASIAVIDPELDRDRWSSCANIIINFKKLNRSLPLVVVRDEVVAIVGKTWGSVIVVDELVDIVTVVLGDSVGAIPE